MAADPRPLVYSCSRVPCRGSAQFRRQGRGLCLPHTAPSPGPGFRAQESPWSTHIARGAADTALPRRSFSPPGLHSPVEEMQPR
eukprot:10558551-Lingulodinium_polyedra.AAC.1